MDESPETAAGGPAPELTGDTAVDAVLSRLSDVAESPVADHAEHYAGLHDGLLAALNEEPATASPPVAGTGAGTAAGPGPVPRPGPA